MRFSEHVLAGVLILCAGAAQAQSLRDIGGPAEVPPASYAAKQYVDSRGCVFVRAGVGDGVTWVPRVDRQRNVLCGYPPTQARPASSVVAEAPARPARTPQASRPAPVAAQPSPTPQPARQASARTYAPSPATAPARGPTVAAVTTGARELTRFEQLCLGAADGTAYRVTQAGRRYMLRCVAQQPHPADLARLQGREAVDRGVTPRRVTAGPGTAGDDMVIPEGYQSAYPPGRLNPWRGVGTPEGEAAMNRRFSGTLPMREATRRTPRVVAVHPARAAAPGGQGVYASGKNAPAAAAQTGRRVQVATFGEPANTDRALRRFRALGLPVQAQAVSRGGRRLDVVYLGPFARADDLRGGLAAAQRAGFADARVVP